MGGAGEDRLNGGAGRDVLTGGTDGDTFVFAAGMSGVATSTSDWINDWTVADQIDMAVAGASGNYREAASTATTIEKALLAAEALDVKNAYKHVFLFNAGAKTGFLLSDLDSNGEFEAGVVLKGGTMVATSFSHADFI